IRRERLEGAIRTRAISRTALRVHRFLSDKPRVVSCAVSTILNANGWADSIHAGERELVSQDAAVSVNVCDLIQTIAETLIENAAGNERQLLLKSLQEALFYSLGPRIDLTPSQVKTRLKRFLRRHNKGAFIQRFLSLYFFNLIWFHTE